MRQLKFEDHVLEFEVKYIFDEHGERFVTHFYSGKKIVKRKKWFFFGPLIEKEIPKYLFSIHADADDPSLSKSWWKDKIKEKLELVNRIEEIGRGELC